MAADYHRVSPQKPFRGLAPASTFYDPYRHRRRRSCFCRCCCCLCTAIAALLLLLFIAASIIYLLLQPKAPNFSVTRAYITEFNVTTKPINLAQNGGTPNQAAFYLQTDMNFTVQVINPNKKVGIYFQQIDVGLGYEGLSVGRGTLPSFYVGVNESRDMELHIKGQDTFLTEKEGLSLQKAIAPPAGSENSTMWVQVEIAAHALMRAWGHNLTDIKALVKCNVEMSRPFPHSSAHIISKACSLKLLSLMQ